MIRAFLLGLKIYARLYLQALSPNNRKLAPLSFRRIVFLLVLMPLFALVQGMHWIGFLLDEIFFRSYRDVVIEKPFFISGIPRSGTTFVHRTLAKDNKQFTSLQTWECLFAPSVSERIIIRFLSRIDQLIGRPFDRFLSYIINRSTGEFNKIHQVDLNSVEEDYLLLLPVSGCFIMLMAFPWSSELQKLGQFDQLPEKHRQVILDFYKACLQKHLYINGPENTLLSKNASFGSWLPELSRQFPDARILVCLRDPKIALSSQLSSLQDGIKLFATEQATEYLHTVIRNNLQYVYTLLREMQQRQSKYCISFLDYDRLMYDAATSIETCLGQLDVTITDKLEQAIKEAGQESSGYVSPHHYKLADDDQSSELIHSLTQLHKEITSIEGSNELQS